EPVVAGDPIARELSRRVIAFDHGAVLRGGRASPRHDSMGIPGERDLDDMTHPACGDTTGHEQVPRRGDKVPTAGSMRVAVTVRESRALCAGPRSCTSPG